jgi:hypothetical protein
LRRAAGDALTHGNADSNVYTSENVDWQPWVDDPEYKAEIQLARET